MQPEHAFLPDVLFDLQGLLRPQHLPLTCSICHFDAVVRYMALPWIEWARRLHDVLTPVAGVSGDAGQGREKKSEYSS